MNQDIAALEDAAVKSLATSLIGNRGGRPAERELVLAAFCNELEELLGLNFDNVLDNYKKVDLLMGRQVWVMPKKRENPERRAASVIDLTVDGNLVVKLDDTGEVVNLVAEEVSIRIQ